MPPKAAIVGVDARVEALVGDLPSLGWRWDPETDILSGSFKGARKSGGLTGTVELTVHRVLGSAGGKGLALTGTWDGGSPALLAEATPR